MVMKLTDHWRALFVYGIQITTFSSLECQWELWHSVILLNNSVFTANNVSVCYVRIIAFIAAAMYVNLTVECNIGMAFIFACSDAFCCMINDSCGLCHVLMGVTTLLVSAWVSLG
jgi:hypothetical protein